jgi:hypothetical protein
MIMILRFLVEIHLGMESGFPPIFFWKIKQSKFSIYNTLLKIKNDVK